MKYAFVIKSTVNFVCGVYGKAVQHGSIIWVKKKYTEKKVAADNFIKLASRRMYLLVLYLKVNNDNEYKV